MSGGLLALLDDVVALTKVAAATLDDAIAQAAKAGSKTAGIVIDDAAVTPRYVVGLSAERELPIIGKIALGSLKNKLLFLLPAAIALSVFAPWLLTPILMVGGLYLAFEGYEKVHELIVGHDAADTKAKAVLASSSDPKVIEDEKIAGAIRTDLVLSAEIMAIALASITEPDLFTKSIVLAVVAVMVTVGVYGAVALIVKADDFGVYLAQKQSSVARAIGNALVRGMPPFLKFLSLVGTFAMLWVGGGILIHGFAQFGLAGPEHFLHGISESIAAAVPVVGGALAWLASATGATIVGLVAGWLTAIAVTGGSKLLKAA